MQTTPSLADAIAYVQAQLADCELALPITICGSIAPGRDSSGPIEGSRDVLFLMPGETGNPNRMTVWYEPDGSLYGEW